jgi:hypothetical protein
MPQPGQGHGGDLPVRPRRESTASLDALLLVAQRERAAMEEK